MIPALVRHVIESTVFAAIVALFPFLMRKRGAVARHAVWFLAAFKFAVPVALFSAAGVELGSFFPVRRTLFAGSTVMSASFLPASPASISAGTEGWISTLFLAVWLGGAAVMLAIWFRGFFAAQGPSVPVLDSEIESLARVQRQIGLRRKIAICSLRSQVEPGIRGVWRLTITLPEGLSSLLAPREFEAVLLHELAHAKRRDNLTLGFVHVLVCLFWFDPLLWWIERRLVAEQELACDEMVLRHGPVPEEYAAGILKVCRFHLTGAIAGACGIAGSNLKSRMEAIMSFKPNHLNQRAPRFLVAALLSAMTIIPLAIGFLTTAPAFAQVTKAYRSAAPTSKPPVTCMDAGKAYPLGSVIQTVTRQGILVGGEQMCVKGPHGHPLWIRTNAEARQRSQHVITVLAPPPVFCKPAPSSSPKYCACENGQGANLLSLGAIVHSQDGKGFLRCDKGRWRPATPAELGLSGKD